jgi:hypothetical protein
MEAPWPTILTSIIVAAVSVLSTIAYQRWAERRRIRFDCFRQMCRHSVSHDEYLKAFSEAPMVFAGCKRVVAAHQAVLDKMNKDNTIISDEMVDFLRECARELNIRGTSEQQLKQRFGAPRRN